LPDVCHTLLLFLWIRTDKVGVSSSLPDPEVSGAFLQVHAGRKTCCIADQGFIYDLQHALVNLEREPKQFATGATSGLLSFAYSAPPQPFESPASAGGLHPLPKAGNPARIPSQLSAAATDPGMSSASRSVGRLDVLSSTPAALSGRAPCIHARGCAALRRNLVRNAG
jgi:hypothetical protein